MGKIFQKPPDSFSSEVLYRFQVVSHIVSLVREENKLAEAIRMVACAKFMNADGNFRHNSIRTLYRWYAAYKEGGVEALKPQIREKSTSPSIITEEQLNFFKTLKENDPIISIPEMIRQAEIKHFITEDKLNRTALWRELKRANIDTGRHRTTKKNRDSRRFEYPHRMDMMLCDGKHFRAGVKRLKRVALFFLDDSTRMGLGVYVGTSENTESFLLGLYNTILKYGWSTGLFVDNGGAFVSYDSKMVLAQLGISFIHGTPRYPEGHGKIERFNQTALNRVIRTFDGNPAIDPDCEVLRLRLQRFLSEEYNHTPHEGIGRQTPSERFNSDSKPLLFKKKSQDIKQLFTTRLKRLVSNDHIVKLKAASYEVPRGYAGERIMLYENLLEHTISINHNGRFIRLTPVDVHSNAREKRAVHSPKSIPNGVQTASQIRYDNEMKPVVDEDGSCQPIHKI